MTTRNMAALTDEQLREIIAEQGMASAAGFELARRQAERATGRISDAMSPDAITQQQSGAVPDARDDLAAEPPTEPALPAEIVETVETANPTADEAQREGTTPGESTPTAPQTAVRSADVGATVAVGGEGEGFREATDLESEAERLRNEQVGVQAQVQQAGERAEAERREFESRTAEVQAEQQRRIGDYERDLAERQTRLEQEAAAIARARELNPLDDPRVVEALNAQIALYNEQAASFQQEFTNRAAELNAYLAESTADVEAVRQGAIARIAEVSAPAQEAVARLQERAANFNVRAGVAAAEQAAIGERTAFGRSPIVAKGIAEAQLREAEMLQQSAEFRATDEFRDTLARVEAFNDLIQSNPNFLNPDLKEDRLAAQKAVEMAERDLVKFERLLLGGLARSERERLIRELESEGVTDEQVIARLEASNEAARRAELFAKPFSDLSLLEKLAIPGLREEERIRLEREGDIASLRLAGQIYESVAVELPARLEVPIVIPGGPGLPGLERATAVRVRPLDWRDAHTTIGEWVQANFGTGAATVFQIIGPRGPVEALIVVTAAGDIARLSHAGGKLVLRGIGEGPGAAQAAAGRVLRAIEQSPALQQQLALARQGLVAPVGALTGIPAGVAPSVTRVGPSVARDIESTIEIALSRPSARGFGELNDTLRSLRSDDLVQESARLVAATRRGGVERITDVPLGTARGITGGVSDEIAAINNLIRRQENALSTAASARERQIILGVVEASTPTEAALVRRVLGVSVQEGQPVAATLVLVAQAAREAEAVARGTAPAAELGRVEVFPTPDPSRLPLEERGRVGVQPTPAVSPFRLADVTITPTLPTEVPAIRGLEIVAPVPATAPVVRDLPFVTPGEQPSVGEQPIVIEEPGPAPAPIVVPSPEPIPTPEPSPAPQPEPSPAPEPAPAPVPPPPFPPPPPDVPPPGEPPPPREPPPRDGVARARPLGLPEFVVQYDAPQGSNAPVVVAFRTGAIERRIDLRTLRSEFGPDLSPQVPNDPRISPQDSLRVEQFGNIDRRFVTFDAGRFMGQLDTRRRTVTFVPKASTQGQAFQRFVVQEAQAVEQGFGDNERDGFEVQASDGFERDAQGRFLPRRSDTGFGRRQRLGFRKDV